MKKITFLLDVYFCVQIVFSQQVKLMFQPEKGSNLNYLLLGEGTTTQSMMGMEQVVNSKTEARYSYLIQEVLPNGDVEIVVSIDTVKTNVKATQALFDTTFVIPVGFKFKQILDKYGKSKKFEILEMKEFQLPGGMGRGIAKRNYSHSVIFPEKELKRGDSWDFSYDDSTSAEAGKTFWKVKGKYTFEGIEDKNGVRCAKLNLDANFSISGQGVIRGMNYGLEGEGKNVGTIWVDVKTGVVVHSEVNTEIEMAMGISGQVEMAMPMTQKFKTTVSLLK